MEKVRILADSVACLQIPFVLKGYDDSFELELDTISDTRSSIAALCAKPSPDTAPDIAFLVVDDQDLTHLNQSGVKAVKTHTNVRFSVVGPEMELQEYDVEWEWLRGKTLVTTLTDSNKIDHALAKIYGTANYSRPTIHQVQDVKTLNMFVRSGWGYGLTLGEGRAEVFPGIFSVPLNDNDFFTSVVCAREQVLIYKGIGDVFRDLCNYAMQQLSPSWLYQEVAPLLPLQVGKRLTALAARHGVSDPRVVAMAVGLYAGMLERQTAGARLFSVQRGALGADQFTEITVLEPSVGRRPENVR